MLAETAYGKSNVRLVKVSRHGGRHDLIDWTVAIRFQGDYESSYTDGDNREVLPTDTMKNTVYALAGKEKVDDPEPFGMLLANHFLERNSLLQRIRVDVTEHPWGRITVGNREHGHAFVRQGGETRSATISGDRGRLTIGAGLHDLIILKSADSAFAGFLRDELTTLPDTSDRLLATSLTATWRYRDTDVEFGSTWHIVRQTLLEAFAEHESKSVQHTMHTMGQAVIASVDAISAVRLVMPNKHHLPVDLARLGGENRNELFVPTDEPYGLIEATILR